MVFDAPLHVRFRRSLYLTLALACAALGYAELTFLPETAAFMVVVGILLIVAYRSEGRWTLGPRLANVFGAVIGSVSLGWVVYQFFRPWGGTLLDQLPWPTSLLPYLGPMLMILIPAKLFRPKHTGDFWGLQGIGLMAVALGCALAGDANFCLLSLAYLVSLVWSLTLFYLVREGERPGVALGRARESRAVRHSVRWLTAVLGLAICLFLLTPRNGDARWELVLNTRVAHVGIDERTQIDLNRSGSLKANRDLVYEVVAKTADGRPKTDVDPSQRWRSTHFNFYEAGRWDLRQEFRQDARGGDFRREQLFVRPPPEPPQQPDLIDQPLEANEFTLEFHPQRGAPGQILAEPVLNRRVFRGVSNLSNQGRNKATPWFNPDPNDLQPVGSMLVGGGRTPYRQIVTPTPEQSVRPALRDDDFFRQFNCECSAVPRVHKYTSDLIQRYVAESKLPPAAWNPNPARANINAVPPELAERVAHALTSHLSASGRFSYTLELVRGDDRLDPVEDFLENTTSGHCNRFASALTLMLRSQGIPARIVLGFMGYETEDEGKYEIRQCHAHSWVEALIRREENGKPVAKWLTLDPTPTGEVAQTSEFNLRNWWEAMRINMAGWFRNFIVEYDSAQQDRAASLIGFGLHPSMRQMQLFLLGPDGNEWWRLVGLGAALFGGVVGVNHWRKRRLRHRVMDEPSTSFYRQFLDVLSQRLQLTRLQSQTPVEFAAVAGGRLGPDFADLPGEAAVAYYRVRYGGERLADDERSRLDTRIAGLDAALTGSAAPKR